MNWNKLILIGGLALTVAAVPAATAQLATRGTAANRGGAPRTSIAAPSARSFNAQPGHGSATVRAGRGNFNHGTGHRNHWGNGDHRWGRHRHRHHHFRPYFDFYPFGYPFWGTSASLYYNGYYPRYVQRARAGGSVTGEVQLELAEAGYYHGAIDGILGDGTRRAIRAYERANGLPVDGRIDARLLAAMGLG